MVKRTGRVLCIHTVYFGHSLTRNTMYLQYTDTRLAHGFNMSILLMDQGEARPESERSMEARRCDKVYHPARNDGVWSCTLQDSMEITSTSYAWVGTLYLPS